MNPFPKWAGWLGAAASIYGSLAASGVFAYLPAKANVVIAAVGSFLALFAHSATGNGGETPPTQKPVAGA